jgi:hypothetical protein
MLIVVHGTGGGAGGDCRLIGGTIADFGGVTASGLASAATPAADLPATTSPFCSPTFTRTVVTVRERTSGIGGAIVGVAAGATAKAVALSAEASGVAAVAGS